MTKVQWPRSQPSLPTPTRNTRSLNTDWQIPTQITQSLNTDRQISTQNTWSFNTDCQTPTRNTQFTTSNGQRKRVQQLTAWSHEGGKGVQNGDDGATAKPLTPLQEMEDDDDAGPEPLLPLPCEWEG